MTQTSSKSSRRRILAVIVLYKTTPGDSVSYQSLLRAQSLAQALDLAIVLYDNSPGTAPVQNLPRNTRYIADTNNYGLATAYNLALNLALTEGYDWLLTLDQDTHLPPETFQIIGPLLEELTDRPDIAAIVPEIHADKRIVSPNYFAGGAWPRWFPEGFLGIAEQQVYAFNSGSLLRTTALRQIGGYSPWFWLDNSDSMLYRQLAKFGKRVFVAGRWKVDHDFSMLNLQEKVSPERYQMILLTESAFWDMEMNALAGLERTGRLVGRLVKHRVRGDSFQLQRFTRQALWARLFCSRTQRIARWKRLTEQRLEGVLPDARKHLRPMVSVCMAAYNGESYIEAQLRSILPQLGAKDEIVIVDDASQDGTLERIESIRLGLTQDRAAPRIVLLRQSVNQGVVRTFEKAVRSASGDLLFLCDDDDLWAPNRVDKVVHLFERQPEVDLVVTGLTLIDQHGMALDDTGFMKHRSFKTGFAANFLHNQFQGSAMAFRATLLHTILPFPATSLFLHDAWIGMRCALAGKKAAFLNEPLLLYRRHSGNYSQCLSRMQQVRLRLQLLKAHMQRLLKGWSGA